MRILFFIIAAVFTKIAGAAFMTCPASSPMCGVLAIESGFGPNAYKHPAPGLHGLWPETGAYGTSACQRPQNATFDASAVARQCAYVNETSGDWVFARHEWAKHGMCAGGPGPASAYFAQACSLARVALSNLTGAASWQLMQAAAQQSPFLWGVSQPDKQLLFSVCATGINNTWTFCTV